MQPDVKFIKTGQPKITIPARKESVEPYINRGWIAQPKIDGWKIQAHISDEGKVICLTKNENRLKQGFPLPLKEEIRKNLLPTRGFNVVEGEWVQSTREFYVFDFIVKDGASLKKRPYKERYALLCSGDRYLIRIANAVNLDEVLLLLQSEDPLIEGLVLKDPEAVGFNPNSMRRSRKDGHRHSHKQK